METHWKANPAPQSLADLKARQNPEYERLHNRIITLRCHLDKKQLALAEITASELGQELREKLRL